jgi:PAS domain S-box-containing protein
LKKSGGKQAQNRQRKHAPHLASGGLYASHEMFMGLVESAPDGIIIVNSNGHIVLVNTQAEKLFGYTRHELVGEPVEILIPESLRGKHLINREGYISEPHVRPMGSDLIGRRKDGSEFPVEISLSPIKAEGKILVTSIIRDVTDRKRTEDKIKKLNHELEQRVNERTAELKKEKERTQEYLDVAGVILVVIEANETVSLINKKGCEVLGYNEKEVMGRNWFDTFIPERLRPEVRGAFCRLIAGELKLIEHFENPVLTQSGEKRIIAWQNTILRDGEGRIYATLSSGEDITEKAQLEQQVRQAEKLAAVGQLTAGLAHEIGTPLNVIAGRAEYMLRKMPPEDPLRENLVCIITQIERITKLVQQLLGFARPKPPQIRPIRLLPMMSEMLALLEHQITQQGITKTIQCSEELPEIMADPDQIQQVIFNLALNAVQAMPNGGNLTIRVHQTDPSHRQKDWIKDHYLQIEVSDTGMGISADKLQKIFDPFFSTKEVGKGAGLGLAVSQSIMREHGGWIDVKSRMREGSSFTLYLPY